MRTDSTEFKCPNCASQDIFIDFNRKNGEAAEECFHCGYAYSKVMTNYEEAVREGIPTYNCNFLIKEYWPELETGKAIEKVTVVTYIDIKQTPTK